MGEWENEEWGNEPMLTALHVQHCNNHLYSQASNASCNTVLDILFFSIDLIY